ncbi:MAG: aminotransferase class I/II-fold pyridoxal phosphate-dependent enzyme [Treponema sp.]|jgi:histidinol-phosphate/aromatic aminotransferase/cobyric acid decarboxylase-like protein/choline kinase|nr:aminotransferase class I/II-fold pyridoxal phosphate-dependent enzyme [Treponema sp.]
MQAVILAAGMGNRLGKYTSNNTKCMLSINGMTLIERALDALDSAGIRKCVIVVGYKKDNLIAFVGNRYKNVEIIYVINDIYNKTNNIYSLYLAKDHLLSDDTLLLESDLIFEKELIADMVADPEPIIAAVAKYESWMDGTVVQLAENNVIASFIQKKFFNYDEKGTYYKTVNIYKFSTSFLRDTYVPFLDAYSHAMGNNEYYEQVLRVIATLDKQELKAFVLTGQKWYEIDDIQDKNIAEIIFSSSSGDRLDRIQKSYGGYWRFPGLLDFCYLVNPYFPTGQMLGEIKAYFTELLASYPSGLNIQNMLAGKLYGVEEDSILVGNGAAELIRALAPVLTGSVGVTYPTFNEYPESFTSNEIIPSIPPNFSYTYQDILGLSSRCDTILLINPDNPSGNFIPAKDITVLLENLKSKNKKLILDESFVDFSGLEENQSLLKREILERFPNLIVIRSLSKSYGIPGLRLGVLASGDRELIQGIRFHLSIWNINSFGEYFLQIIGKYVKDYRLSCTGITHERTRFKIELEKTGLVTVYPSEANYLLCRCTDGVAARELAEYLLEHHDIFIKDLTGKKGIPDNTYIRLAVRNKSDNDKLVEKLIAFYRTRR